MSKRKQKCPNPNILNCNYKEIKQYISNLYEIDPPEYFLEQFQRIHVKNILVTHLETKNEYTLPMKQLYRPKNHVLFTFLHGQVFWKFRATVFFSSFLKRNGLQLQNNNCCITHIQRRRTQLLYFTIVNLTFAFLQTLQKQ